MTSPTSFRAYPSSRQTTGRREITAEAIDRHRRLPTGQPEAPLLYVRDATLSRVIRCEVKHNTAGKPLEDSHEDRSGRAFQPRVCDGQGGELAATEHHQEGNRYVETQVPKA